MDHPLSHLSAVVGAVAFILFFGCVIIWLSNHRAADSSNWWSFFLLSGLVLTTSVIGYVRPYSQAIYVPLLMTGGVSLAFCVGSLILLFKAESFAGVALGLLKSFLGLVAWLAWAARMNWLLREGRRLRDEANRQQFRLP